jgi:hypothetical protein
MYERFWSRVDASGDCWTWTAGVNGRGYGQVSIDGVVKLAHRASYELLVGEIPKGLVIDHLCRNKLCVNPDHLEPVTQALNLQRGAGKPPPVPPRQTHCKRNHPLSGENLYMHQGRRHCRTCRRTRKVSHV